MSYHVFTEALDYIGSTDDRGSILSVYNAMANGKTEATPRYLWETYRATGQHDKAPPSSFDPDSDDGEWYANIFVWEEA